MLRQKQIDMIHGPLKKSVLLYALPVAATAILQQLFNAADIAVVGRFVGTEAMAAVGTDSPLVNLLVNFFVGLSLGSTVVIATAIGRKDEESVHRAVHTSILLSLLVGTAAALITELLLVPMIRMMSVPEEVFDMAVLYMRIYLAGQPVIVLYDFLSAIFRSAGDTRDPLIALVVSGLINVVLNIFFVAGCGMTVDGVSIATVISNAIASMILLAMLAGSKMQIRLRRRELRIDRRTLTDILKIGLPSGIQGMIFAVANIIIQTSINSLGTTVMAASSAAFNVEAVAYYVLNSFGQACTTFTGQNHGARERKRCTDSLRACLLLGAICTGILCVMILASGHAVLSLFNTDPDVIRDGYLRLEVIFFSYIFSLGQEVFSGYLRGFGISTLPAAVSIVGICGVRILWMNTVFRLSPSFRTILLAYPVSNFVTAFILFLAVLRLEKSDRTEI